MASGRLRGIPALARDPLLKRLVPLVEASQGDSPGSGRSRPRYTTSTAHLSPRRYRLRVEDWAAQVFKMLLFNLSSIAQRAYIYEPLGSTMKILRESVREAF